MCSRTPIECAATIGCSETGICVVYQISEERNLFVDMRGHLCQRSCITQQQWCVCSLSLSLTNFLSLAFSLRSNRISHSDIASNATSLLPRMYANVFATQLGDDGGVVAFNRYPRLQNLLGAVGQFEAAHVGQCIWQLCPQHLTACFAHAPYQSGLSMR